MKILLLTDVPPCKDFSGALLSYHLCGFINSSEEIVCAAVQNKDLSYVKTSKDLGITTLYLTKPKENTNDIFNGEIKLITFINELLSEIYYVPRLAGKIIDFARLQHVDRIWCILQGQTTIRLAKIVSKSLNLPLLTQVWDHPIWWMGHNKIDNLMTKKIIRNYEDVLSMSACCGAASFIMADQILTQNKVPSIPLVSCLPTEYAYKPISFPNEDKKTITIGFSGQTYADQAIDALYNSLDLLDWEINGKQVKLRYLGYHITLSGHHKRNIEYLGYRDQEETIQLLSECDLLFCPYIINPKYKIVAQTSFPSKLTTYLATGVPVLFLGTEDSSPAIFLHDNNAGYICANMNSNELANVLQQVFADPDHYEMISRNGLLAFHQYLTNEKQKERFLKFLGYAG